MPSFDEKPYLRYPEFVARGRQIERLTFDELVDEYVRVVRAIDAHEQRVARQAKVTRFLGSLGRLPSPRSIAIPVALTAVLWWLGVNEVKAIVVGLLAAAGSLLGVARGWIERGTVALLAYALTLWIGVAPAPDRIRDAALAIEQRVVNRDR